MINKVGSPVETGASQGQETSPGAPLFLVRNVFTSGNFLYQRKPPIQRGELIYSIWSCLEGWKELFPCQLVLSCLEFTIIAMPEANSGVVSPGNLHTAQGKRHFHAFCRSCQDLHRIDIPGQKAHAAYDAASCPEQRADVGTIVPAA